MNARPLVVRFGALGDMALLTVLIRHLSQRFGQPVDVVSSGPWTRPLLESQPGVGNLYVIGSRNLPYWLSRDQQQLVHLLRTRGAGPTWLCDHYHNEKTFMLLQRAGWSPQHWCQHFGFTDLRGTHFCDLWLRYAYRNPPLLGGADLPCTATDAFPQLLVSDTQQHDCAAWLATHGLDNKKLILIQAGNKRTMRKFGLRQRSSNSKYWPENNWAAVLRGLRELHPDHAMVMLGVPSEAALNDDIVRNAAIAGAYNLAPEMNIAKLMALCARADGMISVDTGPAHVAAAIGCPVLTLFGKADPAMYAPRGPNARVRCLTGRYHGEVSMLGIEPRSVIAEWQLLMSTSP